MRITGGESRGKPIYVPKGAAVRPTSDRVREALFAVLYSVSGKTFLDLFAGSGGIGLEALSRGARKAVLVEKDTRLIRAMKKNLAECGFEGRYEIMAMEVRKCVRLLAEQRKRFEILFADPPYGKGLARETLEYLRGGDIVSPNGVVVLQHSTREALGGSYGEAFTLTDQKRYGDTVLSFLKPTFQDEREAYEKGSGISRFF
jgi:16S rRNA (guanine966-N2)-methyltransferase